jgi:hypothetical protein
LATPRKRDKGPVSDLNILGWPTIYSLDHEGQIAAKELRGDKLNAKIAELMRALE